MTREEFRDYVDFLRSQDEISYDVYSALIDGIDTLEQEPKTQMVDKSNFDIEQYKMDLQCAYDCGRASVEPKTENYDANFLEFLFNVINPNEMEKYMAMYNSSNIPAEGSSK